MKSKISILLGAALCLLVTFGGTQVATVQAAVTEKQKLTASDGFFAEFGLSVSVSGDFAIVGGWGALDANSPDALGAACVFERIGGVWTQVARLTASDGAAYDFFGTSAPVGSTPTIAGDRRMTTRRPTAHQLKPMH